MDGTEQRAIKEREKRKKKDFERTMPRIFQNVAEHPLKMIFKVSTTNIYIYNFQRRLALTPRPPRKCISAKQLSSATRGGVNSRKRCNFCENIRTPSSPRWNE